MIYFVTHSFIRELKFIYDCIRAIDGTHIFVMIPSSDVPSYRNRNGFVSQNVLDACNFDLEFMYVLSGWEGSAHDSKILSNALTRNTSRLHVPDGMYLSYSIQKVNSKFFIYTHDFNRMLTEFSGKFYLVDCGFSNHQKNLAHFRRTRYHLQEFRGEGRDPQNQNELFNLRHASLRNVIERIFGIFKSRFLIFKSAPPFSFKHKQSWF